MSTQQETITLKIMERIRDGLTDVEPHIHPPSGMATPHRAVSRPLDEDELPCFVVSVTQNNEDDESGEENNPDNPFKRVMWVWIEARILGPSADASPEQYLDPYVDYIYSLLFSDPQIGGTCSRVEGERVIYEGWEGKESYLAAAMLFRIYYIGDPI